MIVHFGIEGLVQELLEHEVERSVFAEQRFAFLELLLGLGHHGIKLFVGHSHNPFPTLYKVWGYWGVTQFILRSRCSSGGCSSGEDVDWKLYYSKDGMIFPAATGTQETVATEKAYDVLDYVNLNKLQGNTSFFLTYGGKNSATYFRQLEVHIGTHVSSSNSMEVHSMYGNISVNFPPRSW